MKVAFFGSTNFSLEILRSLFKLNKSGNIELKYVVTQPAKPFGRKRELKNNPVADFCIENSIKLFTPNKIKELNNDDFKAHNIELGIVAAYGKILPEWLLESSENGFINFHGSVLPKYRGAVPVQMSILNQDLENAGVTIQKMEKEMDVGDVIEQINAISIENTTSGELMESLARESAHYIMKNPEYLFDPLNWKLRKQDNSQATYCYVDDMTKEKMEVKYEDGVKLTHGKIMAANPEPKAWTKLRIKNLEYKINLVRSRHIDSENEFKRTGTLNLIFDTNSKKLLLELNDGFIEILEIQPEGKNVMDGKSFANGYL